VSVDMLTPPIRPSAGQRRGLECRITRTPHDSTFEPPSERRGVKE
jgi:hypothetical protein